jgi:small subunit ribosomal protein S4
MARNVGPVCRLCRREGVKLMLKGNRCESAKCPMEKQWRQNPPGMHAWRRSRGSAYAVRLREKQKVKRFYGVWERQFMNYFRRAERSTDNTGQALLSMLERRLDNVVSKLNFAASRPAARVVIAHGHIYVNGRRVNRPGYLVRQGDRITIKPADKSRNMTKLWAEALQHRPIQPWLQLNTDRLEGTVVSLPTRDDVQIPVEEQLIVEMCSR